MNHPSSTQNEKINADFFRDNTQGMSSELKQFYESSAPVIQNAIEEFYPERQSASLLAELLQVDPSFIDEEAVHRHTTVPNYSYINRPGKLLRPVMTAAIMNAYGENFENYASVLAMIEVMEVTTIMLNDIWDDSIFRRGGYCAQVQYGRETAHIAGLAGYYYCFRFLTNNELRLPPERLKKLYDGFAYEDVQWFLHDIVETMWPLLRREVIPDLQFFQEVVSRCAFLSFRGPARIGAILGDAPEEDGEHLENFGMYIGLAYHLRGDILNLFPGSNTWGKIPHEDITAGRRSLLTSAAIKNANSRDRHEMLQILDSRTKDPRKIERFTELLRTYGAADYCERVAQEMLTRADDSLNKTGIPPAYKKLLRDFASFMVRRKK